MKIVDNKEVAKNVHLDVGIEGGNLVIAEKIALVAVAGPLLDKIAELIPGHFEDAIIAEAKKKLEDLAAQP